jgi:hypothetical protein
MVVLGAATRGDAIVTSDPDDVGVLMRALGARQPPPIIRV